MKIRKAIKRIGALAAGTTMVTATIMGAMANLSDYPEPFVNNGVFTGKIVIGQSGVAQVSDVLGAIDIAASLQQAAVTPVNVGGSSSTVSVSGGVALQSNSDKLNFGEQLDAANQGKYDNDDFPDLLADGTIDDDDGSEYDYEQFIYVPDAQVSFGQDDDHGDDPLFFLDLAGASSPYIHYEIEFDEDVPFADGTSGNNDGFEDSESFFMFGKEYTVDPDVDSDEDGDLILYGSDVIVTVSQEEPVTVEVEGQEYTIEVLGGNSDDSTAIIRVTGSSTDTETMSAGGSKTLAGLDIVVDDVFISNIGANTISVSIFVGSNELNIPASAVSPTSSYQEIEINGVDSDIEAWVEVGSADDLTEVQKIHFRVDPTDFVNERTDDEWDWLIEGDTFVDSLFGFELDFDSYSPMVENRELVELSRSGDGYNFQFTNIENDEFDFEIYQSDGTTLSLGEDLQLTGTTFNDDDIFILEEDSTNREDAVTRVFEVRDIDATTGQEEITLRDLGTGATIVVDEGDEIEDTGITVGTVNSSTVFTLSGPVLNYVVTKTGLNVTLDTNVSDGANLTVSEDSDDLDDISPINTFDVDIVVGGNAGTDNDEDIAMPNIAWTLTGSSNNATVVPDSDSDVRYGVSEYGTWFEQEVNNDGDYLRIYTSEEELSFNVFLNGPDAVVVTSGGSSSGTAYQLNEFVVGQIAIYDNEAMSMIGSTPLIAVGGPCVNTVAMELMGNPEVCYEGFTQGRGKIKFFDSQNALLVAGYSGDDTTGASYVLADYESYSGQLVGDEVEVIVTSLDDLEVVPLS